MIGTDSSLSRCAFTQRTICVALSLVVLLGNSVRAEYPVGTCEKVQALVDEHLKRPGSQSISVGLTLSGEPLYFHGGTIDAKPTRQPDERTIYEIGSISKTITGTLLAQAALAKQINLDDDIRKYLSDDYPNLVFENEPIRVKHLLNHTSGLPRILPHKDDDFKDMSPALAEKLTDIQAKFSDQDLLQALHAVKLTRRPGESFSYSNTAARVCGILLQSACKKSFDAMLKDFFAQSGMHNSWSCASGDLTASDHLIARGHDLQGHLWPPMPCTMAPAGAVLSTAEDMLVYARMHLDRSNEAAQLSHQATWGDIRYYASGLNWQMERPENKPYRIWQSGSTGGSTAYLQLYPDEDFAVVLLTNEGDENSEGRLSELAAKIHTICISGQ